MTSCQRIVGQACYRLHIAASCALWRVYVLLPLRWQQGRLGRRITAARDALCTKAWGLARRIAEPPPIEG